VTPRVPAGVVTDAPLLPVGHDDEAWVNLRKRMTQRYEQIELGWECSDDR